MKVGDRSFRTIWLDPSDDTAVQTIHAPAIWKESMDRGDAIPETAEYGTPDMARSVQQFVEQRAGLTNIFTTSGHEDGVLAFGGTLPEACQRIFDAASRQP